MTEPISIQKDPYALAYRYREYMKEKPWSPMERCNPYYERMLANLPDPDISATDNRSRAIRLLVVIGSRIHPQMLTAFHPSSQSSIPAYDASKKMKHLLVQGPREHKTNAQNSTALIDTTDPLCSTHISDGFPNTKPFTNTHRPQKLHSFANSQLAALHASYKSSPSHLPDQSLGCRLISIPRHKRPANLV
ncbi:hypothetical protein BKA58DRAFT_401004 [Alternaria rosae]|uniref:uncharacterized protein n=1 Tax=Alternaria rosae TaxID=1187941 RepID=UPI001E8E75B3|nr:uncharacterized protein BKA58DRAFT_401004 [Alternaria rosae]KAH6872816.1 hypothetical protein BKA58DRAFT_401004 [Alternaria rosae]